MVTDPVCNMALNPLQAAAMTDYKGKKFYFCSQKCEQKFLKQPDIFINKAPAMHLTIGVMGSASDTEADTVKTHAYQLGKLIAEHNFILITGACPGLPYECARGAKENGGLSIGISPALSLDEHVHKYHSPSDTFDIIIYTGSGLMGREVTNIRSSDMVIILGGQSGTLGEFSIAYDEGKLIGVLEGSGGITTQLPGIENTFTKTTGAKVIYEADPAVLVSLMTKHYKQSHYRHPSCFCHG